MARIKITYEAAALLSEQLGQIIEGGPLHAAAMEICTPTAPETVSDEVVLLADVDPVRLVGANGNSPEINTDKSVENL